MNKLYDFEYLIIGGGCAGLSLTNKLSSSKNFKNKLLIIEEREVYTDDKSWCFWQTTQHDLYHLVKKEWSKWSFSLDDTLTQTHNSHYYSYQYIRSIDFYNYSLKNISLSINISLKLNTKVLAINKDNNIFYVKTNEKTFKVKYIVDTRPSKKNFSNYPLLHQCFLGREVEIKNYDYFNEGSVHLMSNMRTDRHGMIFNYILPITKRRGLIETTRFSKVPVSKEILYNDLNELFKYLNIKNYTIFREEYGSLPMGFLKKKKESLDENSYFQAGISSGLLRASSGYGFLRIQEWSRNCSNNIINGLGPISNIKESKTHKVLDKVFLEVIYENIKIAPTLFMAIGKKCSSKRFVDFMNGKSTLFGILQIVLCLPSNIFLIHIFKKLFRYYK